MKSCSCIENCGACCKFDLDQKSGLKNKLSKEDLVLINLMTTLERCFKNLKKQNKKYLIYENRPHFCREIKFSISFKNYSTFGDKILIYCCKQHISSNYGESSEVMSNFLAANIK